MCGIAGLVHFSGLAPHERDAGAAMARTLRHRGPDGHGAFCDGRISLGHARLSIIDPDGGHQPVGNEDGSVQVVFNGEIYNHRELAAELRARGHRLRSRCDCEVIPHLYEQYGDAFVDQLNGMFAIGLWDGCRRRLLLVRDRMGIKPLYWSEQGDRVAFGSELKAVLAAGHVSREVDACALVDYLTFGHVPAPRTIFRAVRKLEPGCMAVCTGQGVAVRRYWDIPFADDPLADVLTRRQEEDWIEAFSGLLEDAAALRRVADVPVGTFLSGGVDSAAVTAAMCRGTEDPVLTHTVGFDESGYDERDGAGAVARRLGTDHHEVLVRADAAWAVETLTRHFDEPFADSSAVPTFYLSRVARERVKVALAGDGGDELLAGYRRYRFDLAERRCRAAAPPWLRRCTAGVAGWLYPRGDWMPRPLRAKRTLQNIACDDATGHLRSVAIDAGTLPARLLAPEVLTEVSDYDAFTGGREWFARCPSRRPLNRLLYMDLKTLLPDDMLTKVDRASMAVGLEVRVPLLDHRLVSLAARMPPMMKLRRGVGKYVLRRTAARWLGEEIAHRPKKGFDVPIDAWFRGPLRTMSGDLLLTSDAVSRAWIEPAAVANLWNAHQQGRRSNGHVLWTLLSLELWARAYGRPDVPIHREQHGTVRCA